MTIAPESSGAFFVLRKILLDDVAYGANPKDAIRLGSWGLGSTETGAQTALVSSLGLGRIRLRIKLDGDDVDRPVGTEHTH